MKKLLLLATLFLLIQNTTQQVHCEEQSVQNNYLKIERNEQELNSRLNEKYKGYSYKITNIYNTDIELSQTILRKNANAQIAYLSVKIPEQDIKNETFENARKNALKTIGLAYLGAITTLPFKQISNNIGNKNAQEEAEKFDKTITKQTTLKKGASLEIRTMALKKYKPILLLIYTNPITDENSKLEL